MQDQLHTEVEPFIGTLRGVRERGARGLYFLK